MSDEEYYAPVIGGGFQTVLTLLGMGVTLFSSRGLVQTLAPIEAATQQARTINGQLQDLSVELFHKYRTTITCVDQRVPALDGIFPGRELTVHCAVELACPVGDTPARPAAPGSTRVEHGFTFYRPVLVMLVTTYSVEYNEWGASVGWSLEMEER